MIRNDIKSFNQLDSFINIQVKGLESDYIKGFGFVTSYHLRGILILKYLFKNQFVIDVLYSSRLFGVYQFNEIDIKRLIKDIKYLLVKYGWEETFVNLNNQYRKEG